MMQKVITFFVFVAMILVIGCSHDKYPLPTVPSGEDLYGNIGKQVYNLINPILDAGHGYSFNHPSDIYVGVDNFIYVCDTDNNRIVMLDLGGAVQGVSQFIEHPEAITQNDKLELLIVNKTNRVYKIDQVAVNHNIGAAPVDTVFEQSSEPSRQFTGITVYNGSEYYVTVVDVADSSTNYLEFSFVYDFNTDNTLKGPVPLFVNGTGLYSVIVPTSIVSLREQYLDVSSRSEDTKAFMFTHTGRTSLLFNAFKYQYVTTRMFEGQPILTPNTALIGTDIYSTDKFWNLEDVAIDRQGFIFLVDAGGNSHLPGFYRFAPSGLQMQSVLAAGSGPRQFNNPKGIAVTPFIEDQTVYVADTGNNRIMMFQLSTE